MTEQAQRITQRVMSQLNIGRDENGRFLKGAYKGGPGRKPRVTEASYLAAMLSACTPEDWVQVTERAVKDAKKGDSAARAWLAKYLLGEKPTLIQAVAIDTLNSFQTPETYHLSELAKSLAGLIRQMNDAERDRFDPAIMEISKLIARTQSNRQALLSMSEDFDGDIDQERPELALYDMVSILTEDHEDTE